MKRFALMLAIMMLSVFCYSFAFADIINPNAQANDVDNIPLVISEGSGEEADPTDVEQTNEVPTPTEEVKEPSEVNSGEVTEAQEESTGIEDGKGGNPVGGIIAIVVVLLLVLLIAFLNRG